jgi:hypothetical protein
VSLQTAKNVPANTGELLTSPLPALVSPPVLLVSPVTDLVSTGFLAGDFGISGAGFDDNQLSNWKEQTSVATRDTAAERTEEVFLFPAEIPAWM